MSRNLSAPFKAALAAGTIRPAFLVMLTFKSGVRYAWSGVGNLVYGGQTYLGVGSLGKVANVGEGTDVSADGTSVGLSGIDPDLAHECESDILLGAPAIIRLALLDGNNNVISAPILYGGTVDRPTETISAESIAISLALENRMVDLQRANQRRYTAADQHLAYPNDSGFNWVEMLNDIALRLGH